MASAVIEARPRRRHGGRGDGGNIYAGNDGNVYRREDWHVAETRERQLDGYGRQPTGDAEAAIDGPRQHQPWHDGPRHRRSTES